MKGDAIRLKIDGDRVAVGCGMDDKGVLAILMHDTESAITRVYTHDEWNSLPVERFRSEGRSESTPVTVGIDDRGYIIPITRGGHGQN